MTIILNGSLSDTTGSIQYMLIISSINLARIPVASSKFKFTSYNGIYGVQTKIIDSITNTFSNKVQ